VYANRRIPRFQLLGAKPIPPAQARQQTASVSIRTARARIAHRLDSQERAATVTRLARLKTGRRRLAHQPSELGARGQRLHLRLNLHLPPHRHLPPRRTRLWMRSTNATTMASPPTPSPKVGSSFTNLMTWRIHKRSGSLVQSAKDRASSKTLTMIESHAHFSMPTCPSALVSVGAHSRMVQLDSLPTRAEAFSSTQASQPPLALMKAMAVQLLDSEAAAAATTTPALPRR